MDPSGAPSTPPRPRKAIGTGSYTPKSASWLRKNRNLGPGKSLRMPKWSPFVDRDTQHDEISPKMQDSPGGSLISVFSEQNSPKSAPDTPLSVTGSSLFIPTPSTVGTGRKPRSKRAVPHHTAKAKSLLERLEALSDPPGSKIEVDSQDRVSSSSLLWGDSRDTSGDDIFGGRLPDSISSKYMHHEQVRGLWSEEHRPASTSDIAKMTLFGAKPLDSCSPGFHESTNMPRTPLQNPLIEQKPQFEAFADFGESVQITNERNLDQIPRFEPVNPFLDPKTSGQELKGHRRVNYDTHMELVNTRTGERKVEALTEEQRKFRPRKLDFTQAVTSPKAPDYKIANKYVESSIGKNFTMSDTRPKGALEFEIFEDSG